jgi:proteasome accessory factor B
MQKVLERILNLLAFLLTVERPVTADEIRDTVNGYDQPSDEAFRRTFERDKDLLRSLGVPIDLSPTDVWEVELGYVVPTDDYVLEDPGLTEEERSALLLAAQAVRFGGQPTEIAAIFKLGGASRTLDAGPIAADLGFDLERLGSLFDGVATRRLVDFTYRGRSRRVRPYGLVHRFGHWYLIGPETGDDVVKAFRVDRMEGQALIGDAGAFDRPAGFDPASALEGVADDGDQIALIRFDADLVGVALNRSRAARVIEQDDETALVEMPVGSRIGLFSWLIGFDDRAELIDPAELRTEFLEALGGVDGE